MLAFLLLHVIARFFSNVPRPFVQIDRWAPIIRGINAQTLIDTRVIEGYEERELKVTKSRGKREPWKLCSHAAVFMARKISTLNLRFSHSSESAVCNVIERAKTLDRVESTK